MILHFCGRDEWAAAEPVGEYTPAGYAAEGFIHCSTADQVHLPANALAHGRNDLVLLEIDESLLPQPPRWEPGDPSDPQSMLFPHLYFALPVSAVRRVHDYRPDADGNFAPPVLAD